MGHLPVYKTFPVPYIVLVKDDVPYFKINDEEKVKECIEKDLCTVCGKELKEDKWLVGGPISAFTSYTFGDLPVHKECGMFSLKACPYMAYSQYNSKQEMGLGVNEKLNLLTFNPTMDSERVPYFAFVKISEYDVKYVGLYRFIKPHLPYLEVEKWKDGKQLNEE